MKIVFLILAIWLLSTSPALAEPGLKVLSAKGYKDLVLQTDYGSRKLSVKQFKELCAKPDVCILDLRDQAQYNRGHIKGAHWLGSDITAEKLEAVVPNKQATIVTYCQNSLGPPTRMIRLTYVGLPQIIGLGYPNVNMLDDYLSVHSFGNYKEEFGSLWEEEKIK